LILFGRSAINWLRLPWSTINGPVDGHAADPKEGEQLDLEAHARLEVGLIDSFPASDAVSIAQSAPTVAVAERSPSIWRSLKRHFK
jgi:hypothetical protein